MMLKKFSVENFKGFRDKIEIDFGTPCNYGFNQEIVENGCVTKGIIYGKNGSGKSNLGLALMDIILHLTDKEKLWGAYNYYLNLEGRKSYAEFKYVFEFDGQELTYEYQKTDGETLLCEMVSIAKKEVLYYDFRNNLGHVELKGAEALSEKLTNPSMISRVKYISSNAILEDNAENRVFNKFIDFVNRMLLFFSLDQRGYEGYRTGGESVGSGIISSGQLANFQSFLHKNDIFYNLVEREVDDKKVIYCRFKNSEANFFKIASTGTKSLALFFYWFIRMQEASFVYIDEFDAFYHFELSWNVVEELRELRGIQIFTTTHNTDLMTNDLLRPDCYFKIKDNQILSLADLTDKELRKAHNLQKMYKAGAFDGR